MTDLITDLNQIQLLARERYDEFEVMQYLLERMEADLSDVELDIIIDNIAAPIIDAIDCTKCANCCRSLHVYLTPDDAQQLATGIDVPLETIMTNMVDQDSAQKVGEWGVFKTQPCTFLQGKQCSVYKYRPETCRMYPQFTPDFRWIMSDIIEGAGVCPIIYNVLDALSKRIDTLINESDDE